MGKTKDITAIDLFCGAGGLTLAAQNLGIRVLAAADNFDHACETYRSNFIYDKPKTRRPKLYPEDIIDLDPNRLLSDLDIEPCNLDILMGGPPCQGFSTHRIKDSGVNDPRNVLLLRYFEFVRVLQPKIFLIENVPGLLWPRHAEYLSRFKKYADSSGYRLHGPSILNARNYGVPQNRKRVFIIGSRSDLQISIEWPPPFTHFDPNSLEVKENGCPSWITAASVFKLPLKKTDINAIHMNHSAVLVRAFARTPKNGGSRQESGRTLRCHVDHDGHKDVYGRIDLRKPGPTMTTACINPSKGRFVDPYENRGITLRHAARFQAFPDSFTFCGGLIAGGILVGNAVPIPLGTVVLQTVLAALD